MGYWAVGKMMTNGMLIGYRVVNSENDSSIDIETANIVEFVKANGVKNLEVKSVAGFPSLSAIGTLPLVGVSDQFGRRFEAVSGSVQDIVVRKIGYNLYKVANYTGKMTEETGNQLIFRNCELSNVEFFADGAEIEAKCVVGAEIEEVDNIRYKARDIKQVQERTIKKCDMLATSISLNDKGGVVIRGDVGDTASIPDGCVTLRALSFDGTKDNCGMIRTINCPKSLKEIGRNAFWNMAFLQEIVLNDGLESLDEQFMSGCNKVKEITIPRTVTTIHRNAFKGTKLSCINLYRTTASANPWMRTSLAIPIKIIG